MADDLTFSIASDTTAFDNGIRRGVIKPLEDAEKTVEEFGREGSRNIEKLEDSMDDARRDTERFEDSIKDVRDELTRVGRVGKNVGDDVKRGTDKAERGMEDLKSEAGQTAKESAASFDGSAESIGDSFQEIAANAFSGFGPAGLIAGTAAAIGIGATVAGFEKVEEERKKSQERIAEWAQAFIDSGARVISAGTVIAKSQDILTDPEKFAEAEKAQKLWGVSIDTTVAALAGSPSAIADVNTALDNQASKLAENAEAQGGANRETIQGFELNEIARKKYEELTGEIATGADQAGVYSRILRDVAETTEGATTKVDEFGDKVVTLPDGKAIYIDAETGRATENVDDIEKRIYGLPDRHVTRVDVNTTDLDALERRLNRGATMTVRVNADGTIGRFLP